MQTIGLLLQNRYDLYVSKAIYAIAMFYKMCLIQALNIKVHAIKLCCNLCFVILSSVCVHV